MSATSHLYSIQGQIDAGKNLKITNGGFRLKSLIKLRGDFYLLANMKTITSKYRKLFNPYISKYKIDGVDALRYEYRPTVLSYDLYGTIELAPLLLSINNMSSASQFYNLDKGVLLFNSGITTILDEILIMEEKDMQRNETELKRDLSQI